ncbi:superfamily II DNA or RNA helicase [Staphylococcus caledonicus]
MYKELLKLKNVEIRLTDIEGFHAKGYIFEHENYSSMIIGSSNLTSTALKTNYEHNVLLSTHKNGELIYNVQSQFFDLWEKSIPLNHEWINNYEETFESKLYKDLFKINSKQNEDIKKFSNSIQIKPNKMQEEALMALKKLRTSGEHKGLVVSATGTGKTILCALDVRNYKPQKFLFIVHNEGILKKARQEFKKVFPFESDDQFGFYTGTIKNKEAKYIFATIQSLNSKDSYKNFNKEEFDYIVFDEAHRTDAKTYRKILEYFTPDFFLGMTATPERTDTGNIFELFDNNVAYEIRLPKALESDILCPFHYFGVTDYIYNGVESDDLTTLKDLTSDERINHIIEKTNYYGYSGEELKGLIFVSSTEEAKEIAKLLQDRNIPSKSLTSEQDDQNKRLKIINELVNGDINYIVSVNLLNEGVDIPEVNQIVMFRGTESSIIFIQQLGRGLRKSSNKDYVTVIDFIGNYKNNYLIPIALSDNQSQNKNDYRKFLSDPNQIEGVSTINFEEVAKKKIYDSINEATLNSVKVIKVAFNNVKQRIGRTPMLMDYTEQHSIDPEVIISKFGNYYCFLKKYNYTEKVLSENAIKNLTFLSKEILPGLKRSDIEVLEKIINTDMNREALYENLDAIKNEDIDTSIKILTLDYFGLPEQERYGSPIVVNDSQVSLSNTFKKYIEDDEFKKYVTDILSLSKYYNNKFQDSGNDLILYNQYSRLDFLKLVNWRNDEKNMSNNIYGYRVLDDHIPVFITYTKSEVIDDNIKYEDRFLSQDELAWVSRANALLKSKEIQDIINHKERNKKIYIFVKKSDAEGKLHYYLGEAEYIKGTAKEQDRDIGDRVVTMNLAMKTSIRDDIYRYIVEE